MPIFWRELDHVSPSEIDMIAAVERLKGEDPWKDFYKVKQKIANS